MLVRRVGPLVACGLLVAAPSFGQEASDPPAPSRVAEFIAEDQKTEAASEEDPTSDALPAVPELSSLQALDEETRAVALDAIREYYRYRLSGYEHRRRVFDWQLRSSKIIFWVVILMVSAGIYFSGVQFHIALRAMRAAVRPRGDVEDSGRMAFETSLEASTGGIKVSSPVLGVIILVISFLFFYMYLVHVYPISEIV